MALSTVRERIYDDTGRECHKNELKEIPTWTALVAKCIKGIFAGLIIWGF
jgi:hypothetical protein